MTESENQAELYYERLANTTNPGQVLLEFFRDATGQENAGRAEIILINRLIKLFGRFTTYFAIMELSKYDKLEGNLYPLMHTICKNRFERIHQENFSPSHEPIQKQLEQLLKDAEKVKKQRGKLPDAEGL